MVEDINIIIGALEALKKELILKEDQLKALEEKNIILQHELEKAYDRIKLLEE